MTIDMTLVMEQNEHLGEDQLEKYSIGNLVEPDLVMGPLCGLANGVGRGVYRTFTFTLNGCLLDGMGAVHRR